ncbi:MAG: hypothetical protein ACRD3E_11090 [Terriglobales bacterium]
MRLLPRHKGDLLALPLLLWIVIAIDLIMIAPQAEKPGEGANLAGIAIVTFALILLAAAGVRRKPKS